ncbi:MAG TPA: tRNA (adenosine(37)-N6)-dimethylallyltransferase MiaA [Candidatus Dormibacteraeota bacterium]|nr:tRNA (adenosine(37)-N6)-dimethylallyltransferase MiaA [Candidatus Dormibacteraeota bacterium]
MTGIPVVLGPTAVGKSRVAFDLALTLGREIVVVDSRQVYRRLEIATNKPFPQERARVRYHGLDLADPEDGFNVHLYVEAVAPLLASRPVVVEGGSNLYVDALMDGLTLAGVPPNGARRAELEELSTTGLAATLEALDPAADVDLANRRRLIRAIEVLEVAGPPLAALRKREKPAWEAIRIGLELPRDELAARIAERCRRQLERGLVEETRQALEAGVAAASQALSGTGYAEAVAFIQGRISEPELPELMTRNNRRLAKRQLTWLRRDTRITWFSASPDPVPAILSYLETNP